MAITDFYQKPGTNYYFIKSELVSVFPCAYRGSFSQAGTSTTTLKIFDPESKLNTEKSFLKLSNLKHKSSYVLSWPKNGTTVGELEFVIGGYYFTIKNLTEIPEVSGNPIKYIGIRVKSETLVDTTQTEVLSNLLNDAQLAAGLDISPNNNNNYFFSGLAFSTAPFDDTYISLELPATPDDLKNHQGRFGLKYSDIQSKKKTECISGSLVNGEDNENNEDIHTIASLYKDTNNIIQKNIASTENAIALGINTTASGKASYAEGIETTAVSEASHAEGKETWAGNSADLNNSKYAHAEGSLTIASGAGSHAEGVGGAMFDNTTVSGAYGIAAHSEGAQTRAEGKAAHSEGQETVAHGNYSHAEGHLNRANGDSSHSEGESTLADGNNAHSEGQYTKANGKASHAEGGAEAVSSGDQTYTIANSDFSHAEGKETSATGVGSHTEGISTTTNAQAAHAEGYWTTASNGAAHAEGGSTIASGSESHAEGSATTAVGDLGAHAEGFMTIALGQASHAEGSGLSTTNAVTFGTIVGTIDDGNSPYTYNYTGNLDTNVKVGCILVVTIDNKKYYLKVTNIDSSNSQISFISLTSHFPAGTLQNAALMRGIAAGNNSHAEGKNVTASGDESHAEGKSTKASGEASHAEGNETTASGQYSHTEGWRTTASGGYGSHAEGDTTTASGGASHTEGDHTTASGESSHAEGFNTTASGWYSHAEGYGTTAESAYQHVFGRHNIVDNTGGGPSSGSYVEIVGNGSSSNAPSNARTLDWSGNETLAGDLSFRKGNTNDTTKSKATIHYDDTYKIMQFIFED